MANLALRFNGFDGWLGLRRGKLYTITFRKGHIAQIFESHGVSYKHITDCPYYSLGDFFENWQHPAEGALLEKIREQDKELHELREWKAEIEEQYDAVLDEPCPGDDRKHCTCVPDLRREIARLTEERDAAQRHEIETVAELEREAREMRRLLAPLVENGVAVMNPNDAKAVRAALALARAEREDAPCPTCGGSGEGVVAGHHPQCDGSCSDCPQPYQVQCDVCNGTGLCTAEARTHETDESSDAVTGAGDR